MRHEVTREDGTHEYVFLLAEVLSAAKVKDCEGHGYEYPVRGRIVSLGGPVRGAGSLMPAMAGYRQ